jgi:hypothetical protein
VPEAAHLDVDSALRYANGGLIRPIFNRVPGLSTGLALSAAYVGGLGFDRVISNIPNYSIARVDYTIEGGWHGAVLPFFAMYGPLFFDSFNILFILNITWPLPEGFVSRPIYNADYQRLSIISPVKEFTNSLILTHKASAREVVEQDGMYVTYRFEQETQTQGDFGSPGYQRQETTRKIKEVRRAIDPLTILTEFEEQSKISVYAQVSPGVDSAGNTVLVGSEDLNLVHEETQDNIYDGNGLKTSHKKTISAALMDWTDGSLTLTSVLEENVQIEWVTTEDPDTMVQSRSVTRIEGLVALAENSREMIMPDGTTKTIRKAYPVLAAQFNGLTVNDDFGFFNPWVKIRTITETLRHTKGNQLDVEVQDFDNLSGTMRASITQPRTGTPITSIYQARMRHILLEDDESIAAIGPRIPVSVNAGELPTNAAISLGWDVLRYIKTPRYEAEVILTGLDLSLDRGSVIVPRKREEDASHFIVTGTSERGTKKQSGAFEVIMTLKGQEVNS